jgi:hypothetical protein
MNSQITVLKVYNKAMYKYFVKKTRLITNREKAEKLYKNYNIKTLLDLGSGSNPHREIRKSLGINQILVDIASSNDVETVIPLNIMDFSAITESLTKLIGKQQVDCVVALHVVEHFEKNDSLKLINHMQTWANKMIIIETPNGFVKQEGTFENPYQEHLCGYTVNELRQLGFKVTGTTGLKFLRNNHSKGSYKIKNTGVYIFDRIVFKYLHHFPKVSFNLFAYKILN